MVLRGDGPVVLVKGNHQNRPTGEYSFAFRPAGEHSSYLVAALGKKPQVPLSAISSLPLMASYCPTRTHVMVNEKMGTR
ncbi:hypothetical protein ABIE89_000534 [Bradyrhizobium niftali]